ncbi:MAG: gamma-glutamyltransferase family protein, partial [Mycobacteriales bacterium]
AWLTLLRDHGTLPLHRVMRFALGYAGAGHPLTPRVAATIAAVAEHFRTSWPTSARLWCRAGSVPAAGEVVTNPDLAATYQRLLDEAAAGGRNREAQIDAAYLAWYQGFVAAAIDVFCRTEVPDDSGAPHRGVLTGADLAGWRPAYEQPSTVDWQGLTVCKAGAWSQGPVLLQQLRMLDGTVAFGSAGASAELVHVSTEVAKLAFADREAWYGDVPDVPLETLLSREYAAGRRSLIGPEASYELRPGSPDGRTPQLPTLPGIAPAVAGGAGLGEPTTSRTGTTRGDTCHIDVVDRAGNMVSATPSGGWLQSSPTVPGLGFPLGTRAQMFWLEPGLPNSLAPFKRPRTTLSPTLIARDGVPVLSCGTPGGDQQDQWQLCFLLGHVLGGLDLQAAIDAPAWHTTAFPSSFYPHESTPGGLVVESRLGEDLIVDLRRRGHAVTVAGDWALGRLSAVSRDPGTGVLRAAANPRGMQGYAAGR